MKVFISWSGERSRLVAEALRYWLPKVIQAVQPWMSADDIEKGSQWRTGLTNELGHSIVGIICLTPENLESTWIHFEAGALSKLQQNTRVCTFLLGVEPVDVRDPLAQFQNTKSQMEDVRKLVHTINNTLGEGRLPESELDETFNVWWPKLEERLMSIPAYQEAPQHQREVRDILEEILELVRSQSRREQSFSVESIRQDSPYVRVSDLPMKDVRLLSEEFGISLDEIVEMFIRKDNLEKTLERANALSGEQVISEKRSKFRRMIEEGLDKKNENTDS